MSTAAAQVSLRVPFAASSVASVRRALRDWMRRQDLAGSVIDDARVVVSELVANSIRHARPLADGTLLVAWRHDRDMLEIAVTDGGGTTAPHPVDAPLSATSGRGMSIVATLAEQWWVDRAPARTTVHTLLPLT